MDANPGKRFLYLAFNRATATEAFQRFPPNCDARTTHQLAYQYEGYKLQGKGGFSELNLGEIKQALNLYDFNSAYWIRESLKTFMRSSEIKLEKQHLRGQLSESHLDGVQQLWDNLCDPESTLRQSHNGYLKSFVDNFCQGAYPQSPFSDYQAVLLDEAHDTDPVVERLLRHLAQKREHFLVLVGDSHQAIYAWRGAVNAMKNFSEFDEVRTFHLTGSFRFGPEIASLANRVLDLSTSLERGPDVEGLGGAELAGGAATLTRTNWCLLEEASRLLASNSTIRLHLAATTGENGWSPEALYNFNLFRSVYYLRTGKWEKGMHPRACQFKTFPALSRYLSQAKNDAGDSLDSELAGAVAFVLTHESRTPFILDRIASTCTSPEEADVTLSTAHRAKGLEWDKVRLAEDFEILRSQAKDQERRFSQEEVNLLYVATTRGRESVTMLNGGPVRVPKPIAKEQRMEVL